CTTKSLIGVGLYQGRDVGSGTLELTSPASSEQQPAESCEMPEVTVARHERHAVIDAALCNQAVGESGPQPARRDACSEPPSTLPIPIAKLEHRNLLENPGDVVSEHRIAEQLGEN